MMKSRATYDDASLILRLYELRREDKMRQARRWFAESFNATTMEELNTLCPPGSEENAYFRMVISYWDMTASFITSDVLNEHLFFQSGQELLFVWEKVQTLVPSLREASKNTLVLKNLETVAQAFITWLNDQSPDAYGRFATMVRGQ